MTLTKIINKLALALAACAMAGASVAADNVGFVYVSPIGDAGWTYQHDLGRLQLEKETGVTTSFVENVPEGPDAERVIREMAKRGDKVVFATSFGFMNDIPQNRLRPCHRLQDGQEHGTGQRALLRGPLPDRRHRR
jgi:simple sugar transport system substrate-binding protein